VTELFPETFVSDLKLDSASEGVTPNVQPTPSQVKASATSIKENLINNEQNSIVEPNAHSFSVKLTEKPNRQLCIGMKQTFPLEICKAPQTTGSSSAKNKQVIEIWKPSNEKDKVQQKNISTCYISHQSRNSCGQSKDFLPRRSRSVDRESLTKILSESSEKFSKVILANNKTKTFCQAEKAIEEYTVKQKVSMRIESQIALNKIVMSNVHTS